MQLTGTLLAGGLALFAGSAAAAPPPASPPTMASYSTADIANGKASADLGKKAYDDAVASVNAVKGRDIYGRAGSACTPSKLKIRKEWRTLTPAQRSNYIAAVKCVQSSASVFPPGQAAGAKHLYDDFVAVHMQQTPFIHLSATFLTWHRYYIHIYESKLIACGYTGALPYWEWGLDTQDIHVSPLFDGSPTSLSGDGAPVPHGPLMLAVPGAASVVTIPPGNGGGCVTSGPFRDMTVHLGPIALPVPGTTNTTGVTGDFLQDNPRCLRRDLSTYAIAKWASFRNSTEIILRYNTVEKFQAFLQGDPRYIDGSLGPHGGGHYGIGGNPGGDVFVSPGDPAFFLHHAQVDRMYWIWQMLDLPHRQDVWGTGTLLDMPPSPNVTVNDSVDLGPIAGPVKIKDLMNTFTGSPLCYVYL